MSNIKNIAKNAFMEQNKLIEAAKAVEAIGDVNGVEMYLPEDYQTVQKFRQEVEDLEKMKNIHLVPLEMDKQTYKSSGASVAVRSALYFANKFKVVDTEKEPEVHFVIDEIACDQQQRGTIYKKVLDVYVLVADPRSPYQVKVDRIEKINDVTFINEFRESVGIKDCARYKQAIAEYLEDTTEVTKAPL